MSNKMRFDFLVRILVLFGLTVTMLPMTLTNPPRQVLAQEPGEQQIAYIGQDGNLWLMNSDGSNQTQVTYISEGKIVGYDWSPDDRRLVFVRTLDDESKQPTDIYLLDFTNDEQTPLLADANYYHYGGIAWSPRGDQIAFTTDFVSVKLINIDTKSSMEIFQMAVYGVGAGTPPKMNALNWSPDGKRLAVDLYGTGSAILSLGETSIVEQKYSFFDGDRSRSDPQLAPNGQMTAWMDWEENGDKALVITDIAGETIAWISEDACVDLGPNAMLSWSPDGQNIATSGISGEAGLCLANVETGIWQALVSDRETWNHSWSDSGKLLLFNYVAPQDPWGVEEQTLGIVNIENSQVTDLGIYGAKPSWRPGTSGHSPVTSLELQGQIAYIDLDGNIWARDLAGESKTQLTFEGGYAEPAWSLDGTRIAFVHFTGASEQGVPITEVGVVQTYDLEQRILVEPQRDLLNGVYPYLRNPRWSPDGKFLLYQENTGGPARNSIRKIDMSNGEWVRDFDVWGYSFDISSHGEIVHSVFSNVEPVGMGLSLADLEGNPGDSLIPIEDGMSYQHPRWSPDGSQIAFFARGGQYGSGAIVISSNRGEHLQVVAENVEIGRDDGNWATLTWMPDGEAVVYENHGALYLFSIPDGASQGLMSGYDPDVLSVSQSGVDVHDLLMRKEATIPQLEKTSVDIVGIPFPVSAFDETAARDLVQRLHLKTDDNSLTPEQAEAFVRATLQEESLVGALPLYSQTSADFVEVATDIVGIGLATDRKAEEALQGCTASGNQFSGVCLKLQRMVDRKVMNIINSFGKATIRFLHDPEQQKEFQEFWGLLMHGINLKLDEGGEVVKDILLGTVVKGYAVDLLVRYYVGDIQPSLDQGIHSADPTYAGSEPVWSVEGQVDRATIHTESLVRQATMEAEYAHSVHEDFMRGADMTKLIADIADVAQLSPWAALANIVSIVTRVEHLFIDMYAMKINLNSMTCTRYLSSRAGSLAFNPDQPGESCRDMNSRLPSSPRMARESQRIGDVAVWKRAWLRVSEGSEIYDRAVKDLLAAIRDGDDRAIIEALTNLDEADQIIESATGQATSVILNSDALDLGMVEVLSKSNQFSLNALELYLSIASYVIAPNDDRMSVANIEQVAGATLSSLEAYGNALTASAPTATENRSLAIIRTITPLDEVLVVDKPFEVAVEIQNIGSANANEIVLRSQVMGQDTQVMQVGSLKTNQTHTATLQVQAFQTGTLTLLTKIATDGSMTDSRIDQVMVKLGSTEETTKPRSRLCLGGVFPLLIVVGLLFAGQKVTWLRMR